MSLFGEKLRKLIGDEDEDDLIDTFNQKFTWLKNRFDENTEGALLSYEPLEIEDDGVIWMIIETPRCGWDKGESQTPHYEVFQLCDFLARLFDLTFEGWASSKGGWGILLWRKK